MSTPAERTRCPLTIMVDKQIQFRMGQADVNKWAPEILDGAIKVVLRP